LHKPVILNIEVEIDQGFAGSGAPEQVPDLAFGREPSDVAHVLAVALADDDLVDAARRLRCGVAVRPGISESMVALARSALARVFTLRCVAVLTCAGALGRACRAWPL